VPGQWTRLIAQLDAVKDQELIYRTTAEMRDIYKSLRQGDPRYVRAPGP